MTDNTDNVLRQMVDSDTLTFERNLITVLIRKQSFFNSVKSSLCAYDPRLLSHRQDFSTPRYNTLYAAIYRYWTMVGSIVHPKPANRQMLETFLIDWANKSTIPQDVVTELLEEMNIDFYALQLDDILVKAITGPMFSYWLDTRLAKQAATEISNRSRNYITTTEEIEDIFKKSKAQRVNSASRAENAGDLLKSRMMASAMLESGIPELDKQLGGGFSRGTTTLVAGVNGGGKTVLATQLVLDFAKRKRKVVFATTEDKTVKLLGRMASNHLNLSYSHFTDRQELKGRDVSEEHEIAVIPEWIWQDQTLGPKMEALYTLLKERVIFINWSKGESLNIANHFNAEMEKIEADGFMAEAVVFDWVGGGLDAAARAKLDLRHVYKMGADFLIDYGKQTNKTMIIMAQLNRRLAFNKARPDHQMLAECPAMCDNVTNYIGISALMEKDDTSCKVFNVHQNLFVGKSRDGESGVVPVERHFQHQRFMAVTKVSAIHPAQK